MTPLLASGILKAKQFKSNKKMKNLNHPYPLQLFVFGNDTRLGKSIASKLTVQPAQMNLRIFPDGERIPHQAETVRDRDVFLIFTSQNGPETDKWLLDYMRFVWSIKAGEPHKITVVIPKLPHQRQDVENRELRQSTMSNFFPEMCKAAGADRIVVCRLHNHASRTSNPPMENIPTTKLIIDHIRAKYVDLSRIVIGAGDMGGSTYARKIAEELQVSLVITSKERDPRTGKTRTMKVYTEGDIDEQVNTIVFVDDIIATFGTLCQAAEALQKEFPQFVNYDAIATHADFGSDTLTNVGNSLFNSICVTDTVPVKDEFILELEGFGKSIEFISVDKIIAQTIDNLHNGRSVSELWVKNGNGHQTAAPQKS